MSKKAINSKILKCAIPLVALCFIVTSGHLVFINHRYSIGGIIIPLALNIALHCVALFAATAFSAAASESVYELLKEHDEKKTLLAKEKQADFAEKIISGDFTALESVGESNPSNEKLVAFISGFLSDAYNINIKKAETSKYKGIYKDTLESLNKLSDNLEAANKYLNEASSAIDTSNPSPMRADNPLTPQLKQLLNNMNAVEALLSNLAQMNVDMGHSKIEGDEKLLRSATAINENYNQVFGVLKNNLLSLKNDFSAASRDIQGFSRLNREQSDIINQVKNIVVNMDKQLKTLHSVVFEGAKSASRTRATSGNNAADETIKYIEKINAASNDMAAVMKNLSQLDTQLNKLTGSNSLCKDVTARFSDEIAEMAKNTRSAMDTLDKFNFKGSAGLKENQFSGFERSQSADSTASFRFSGTSSVRLTATMPATTPDNPRERRIKSGNPPLTPRPILKVTSSNYNFDSKDYGKYSRK